MTRQTRPPHEWFLPIYVLIGALEGAIAGWVFLGMILWFDIMGLGGLIDRVDAGFLMFQLAVVFFAVTFGMVGIAWRVMVLLPDEKGPDE